MSIFHRFAVVLILWLPFSLGGLVAIGASLIAILCDWYTYGKNLLRAMDKVLAALFGFSGYFTLSAECGVSTHPLAKLLSRTLDLIDPGHCVGAAKNEKHPLWNRSD